MKLNILNKEILYQKGKNVVYRVIKLGTEKQS